MRQYETTFIIDGQLDEQHREGVIEKFEDILDSLGATRNQTVRWGLRTLAYEIGKHTRGYYVIFYFDADPAIIRAFHHEMDISENILRYMSLKFDGPHPEYIRDEGRSDDVVAIEPEEMEIVDADLEADAVDEEVLEADAVDEDMTGGESVDAVSDATADEDVAVAWEAVDGEGAGDAAADEPVAETEAETDDAVADEISVDEDEEKPAVEADESDTASEAAEESEGSDKE